MKFNQNLSHIIGWSVFISYEVAVVLVISGRLSSFLDYSIHYVLNISFFYLNAGILFNFTAKRIALLNTLLLVIFEVAIYLLINFAINSMLEYYKIRISRTTYPINLFLFSSLWRFFYFFGLSTAYAFAWHNSVSKREIIELKELQIESLKEKSKLEIDLLNSKNENLKFQFNPHLLFNSLNFIYNSIRKISKDGGHSILLLSEITRYTYIVTKNRQMTTIAEEIEQIQNLIDLNKLRLETELYLKFEYSPGIDKIEVVPLVLLTFVENVFKYGDLSVKNQPGHIKILLQGDYLYFSTHNLIESNGMVKYSDQTGIKSTEARLKNFYKSCFELKINNNGQTFDLYLKIKLTK